MALAGKELVVADRGQLGPLDIQMPKKDELYEKASGVVSKKALEELQERALDTFEHFVFGLNIDSGDQISLRTCMELAAQLTSGVFGELYKQLDPQRIAEDARAMQVTSHYGTRLNNIGANLMTGALDKLLQGYPAHECCIDREEAKELFKNVREPSAEESALLELLPAGSTMTKPADAVVAVLYECEKKSDDTKEKSTGSAKR